MSVIIAERMCQMLMNVCYFSYACDAKHLMRWAIFNFTVANDFTTNFSPLPATISFLPIETSKVLVVNSFQDDVIEGTECFYFSLQPMDGFVNVPLDNRTVTICIEDDDSKFVITMPFCFNTSQLFSSRSFANRIHCK